MNRGTIRTEVRDILGEDVADFWKDAELNRYINDAHFRVLNEERWPWLITEGSGSLAAGVDTLELEEGVAASRHVNFALIKDGDSRMYLPKRVAGPKGFDLRTMYNTGTTQSYPEWFYLTSVADGSADGSFTSVVRFVPVPTSDMDVEYQYTRTPDDFTADADVPDMPREYHKALIHYAAGTAWLKELNGGGKAGEQYEMYAGVVAQMRDEHLAQADDDVLVMGRDEPQYELGRVYGGPRTAETLGP